MSKPEGTGSERDRDPGEGIVLPSWIDAAISRTKERGEPLESHQAEPLPDDAVEPMADEPSIEEYHPRQVVPLEPPSNEPFPSFLDRRDSMAYETERTADEPVEADEPVAEESLWPPPATEPMDEPASELNAPVSQPVVSQPPENFLRRRVAEQFEAQRAAIVSEAMAEDPSGSEPIPIPVAPPRRRAPSGPWLMAALFFTAAALVLAILIWLRPLPQ